LSIVGWVEVTKPNSTWYWCWVSLSGNPTYNYLYSTINCPLDRIWKL